MSSRTIFAQSGVAHNFSIGDDGGIARSGNAEASDAEDEPVVLGRGQRKKPVHVVTDT
jgi:hypothetical protein